MAFVQPTVVPVVHGVQPVHPAVAHGVPVVHPRATALDATKQESLVAAERAHTAGLNRAHYEGTAYNTLVHARGAQAARDAQAAARDASEVQRLNNVMGYNQAVAVSQTAAVVTNPTLHPAASVPSVPSPLPLPPVMYY